MASASTAKSGPTTSHSPDRRAAIAAGHPEPISVRGWLRLVTRFALMLGLLLAQRIEKKQDI